jgi:transposase
MERYLGIDPHRDSCTLALVSAQGKKAKQMVVATEGSALVEAVRDLRGPLHVCVEEGEWSEWISEILSPWVARLVVCQPQARRGPKSDASDARELAERLRTNRTGPPVYKPPKQWARLREAVRLESKLRQDVTRTKLRLNSLYRRRGITCLNGDIYQPQHRAEWIERLPWSSRGCGEIWGDQIDALEDLRSEAELQMVAAARQFPIWRTLQTAPGIGAKRAAVSVATVVTPHRFRTKRQFWSYCGLGVVTRTSSDWVSRAEGWVRAPVTQTRGLNRTFNRPLKAVFKGAAMSARLMLPPNPFREHYDRLLEAGTKPNLAQLTLARKLAAIVLAMWKTESEYTPMN